MPTSYRIYTIGRDGHFLGAPEVVECTNDKEAVEKAMQVVNGLDAEIWDHKRLVERLPSNPAKGIDCVSRLAASIFALGAPGGANTRGSIFVANDQPT